MNKHEYPQFAERLSKVMAYYRQPCSDFIIDVFWEGCQPFDFHDVCKALNQHATDPDKGQFAPKVADIVRILGGTKTDRSLREWGRVHEAMSRIGAYTDVDFEDPATHAAIRDMGGWPKLCRTETDQLSYLQHRFCELYKAYDGREVEQILLAGDRSPDEMYRKRGLKPPEPVKISGASPKAQVGINLQNEIAKALGCK